MNFKAEIADMNNDVTENPEDQKQEQNLGNSENSAPEAQEGAIAETPENNSENTVETGAPVATEVEETPENETKEETEDSSSLKAGESVHDDIEDENEEDLSDGEETEEEEEIDINALSKQELVAFVEKVVVDDKILQRAKLVSEARNRFNEIFECERKEALDAFMAIEGNVEMDFQYMLQYIDRQWRDAIRKYSQRKKAIREAIVNERETNLKKKNQLLEDLKALTERATDGDAFDKLKALQDEWRNIGQVPVADLDNLSKNYRFLNDKFFQERALIKEFLDYDRKKNLESKNEIIANIEQLAAESENLRDMMRHYRQLQEAWRDTGPVPRENLDEVMTAFRAANDKITEKKSALVEVVDKERKENQTKKEAIIEKVLVLTDDENDKSWSKRNNELSKFIEDWKKIGAVPRSENQRIRKEFTEAVKAFNKLKNTFFKEQKREKMVNLDLRMDAIKKIEALLEKEGDLKDYRNEVIQTQKYWKTLGHVPRKQSEELWAKFKLACNTFFDRLKEGDKAKFAEQDENLKAKELVCEEIEKLLEKEDLVTEDLKPFEDKWNAIGYVPFNKKKEIDKRYKDAVKQILAQTVKMGDVAPHLTDYKLKIEELMRNDNAFKLLDQERQLLRKKIQKQNDELNTLETNIQFFSNSKGAEKLIAPIMKQIETIKANSSQLKDKNKLLNQSINLLRD